MFARKKIANLFNSNLLKNQIRNQTTITRPLILGIETSCDDTAAALVDGVGKVHGDFIHSQQDKHLMFGGIIPPVAQDLHRQHIENVVKQTFNLAKVKPEDIDAIAVTTRPGLKLSLTVGLRYARYLSRQYSKPIIPIHHMQAHALTARMNNDISYPFLCLLCSGGHCLLTYIRNVNEFYLLGETLDDAPGEALDKISRRMKLRNIPEYSWMSGGAAIEAASKESTNSAKYDFPLPLARQKDCQFSFSGLKNNAKRHINREEYTLGLGPDMVIPDYSDFCAGFLRGISRHICHRTQRAIEFCNREWDFENIENRTLVISGGVACNDFLFNAVQQMASQFNVKSVRPNKDHCTDNGIMIAWNGVEKWKSNIDIQHDIYALDIEGSCPIGINMIDQVKKSAIACKWAKVPILKDTTVT